MGLLKRAVGLALAFGCASCDDVPLPAESTVSFSEFGLAAPQIQSLTPLRTLVVPTYDGSEQAVHPDVLWFRNGWHGYEYWMAFTPYPAGNQRFENPSIAVSHDGTSWVIPPGLNNPIIAEPKRKAFNSDPDLSYDAERDELVLLAREVRGGYNRVSALRSSDGITWGQPRLVFFRRNHGMISPTMVLRPGAPPMIWYVDGGSKKCPKRVTRVQRQTADGESPLAPSRAERSWDRPRTVALDQPGQQIWHLDVTWVAARREYWAVYPAYANSDCGPRDLYFARSRDGLSWTTYAAPLLRHQDASWTSAMLYRASVLYDEERDVVRLFLSASAPGPEWRIGEVEFRLADLLAMVQNGVGRLAVGAEPPSRAFTGHSANDELLP